MGLLFGAQSTDDLLHFSVMPEHHLMYALTWYTLSLCVAILWWRAMRLPAKRPAGGVSLVRRR
jgi:cytochrome oxidase assembly protein ShyY1